MEAKEERADDREVRESYTMLMESGAILRNHRTLRRQICISRVVIVLLLLTCLAFCVIFSVQQAHSSKNDKNTNKEKANETHTEQQVSHPEVNNDDVHTPPMASLSIQKHPNSEKSNLTWWPYHNHLNDFGCNVSCESLEIPQDGKYRLSLQLTYGGSDQTSPSYIDLVNSIVVYSEKKYPKVIRFVTETVFRNRTWFKSVSSEVIYVFNKGDTVMVESVFTSLIYISPNWWTTNLFTIEFISGLRDL